MKETLTSLRAKNKVLKAENRRLKKAIATYQICLKMSKRAIAGQTSILKNIIERKNGGTPIPT